MLERTEDTSQFDPFAQLRSGNEYNGWNDFPLSEEVDTPLKRFSAALNIIKNGGQTITILTMVPFRDLWTNFRAINRNIYRRTGLRLNPMTTMAHLAQTIEPIGAAARSTVDNEEWSLAPFGIVLKPALVFAWDKLLKREYDGMEVFSSTSVSHKDSRGSFYSRAPLSRALILLALQEYGLMQHEFLTNKVGIRRERLEDHITHLQQVGLVSKRPGIQSDKVGIIPYELAKDQPSDWPTYRDLNGFLQPKGAVSLKDAVETLLKRGLPIAHSSVVDMLVEKTNMVRSSASWLAANGLPFYLQEGFLKRERDGYTEIDLTAEGLVIVRKILEPLLRWSHDRWSVEEINRIGRRLMANPYFHDDLLGRIGQSYKQHSPSINKDPEAKQGAALQVIRENPGITQVEVFRRLNLSYRTTINIIQALVRLGYINKNKTNTGKGTRVLLTANC